MIKNFVLAGLCVWPLGNALAQASRATEQRPGFGLVSGKVPAPDLPKAIRDLKDKHHTGLKTLCLPTPGWNPSSQRRAPTPGGGRPVPNGSGGGSPRDPGGVLVHDEPPGGGDGSFNLRLGEYRKDMGNGVFATHSHREPHLLWIVDLPKGHKTYRRTALLLPPDSTIEIALEQSITGGPDFSAGGVVRLEQTIVPGYWDAAFTDKKHDLECDHDYAWKMTSVGVTLAPTTGVEMAAVPPVGVASEHVRMSKMTLKSPKRPDKELTLGSSCASFQICGRWNACAAIRPKNGCAATSWQQALERVN